ncbi:hypothetical protein MRX96_005154 [Rhipicephalus microplus]
MAPLPNLRSSALSAWEYESGELTSSAICLGAQDIPLSRTEISIWGSCLLVRALDVFRAHVPPFPEGLVDSAWSSIMNKIARSWATAQTNYRGTAGPCWNALVYGGLRGHKVTRRRLSGLERTFCTPSKASYKN